MDQGGKRSGWAGLAAAFLAGALARGADLLVPTALDQDQRNPAIAYATTNGLWICAWESESATNTGVLVRRFTSAGLGLGGELRANSITNGAVHDPAVAGFTNGFVVAFSAASGDGSGYGACFRRFSILGPAFDPTQRIVSAATAGPQFRPRVAALTNGTFVAVFVDASGADQEIRLRRFQFTSGAAVDAADLTVNGTGLSPRVSGDQAAPDVARLADGGFVVAFEDRFDGRIYAVRYNAAGSPLDAPGGPAGRKNFAVGGGSDAGEAAPSVAALAGGGFAVAYHISNPASALDGAALARVFASNGVPGALVRLGSPSNLCADARVAGLAGGGFAAAWPSLGVGPGPDPAGPWFGVFSQRFSPTGAPLSVAHRVPVYDTNDQTHAAVAASPAGFYQLAWQSDGQDASGLGVYQTPAAAPDVCVLGLAGLAAGAPVVTFDGEPYDLYTVQRSSNLVAWASLFATNSPTGFFQTGGDASGRPRFYRAVQIP